MSQDRIDADLLLRWCVECLVALGMEPKQAMLLGRMATRTPVAVDHSWVSRVTTDFERMHQGKLGLAPEHEVQELDEGSFAARVTGGHDAFAIHASFERSMPAALAKGWCAFYVDAISWPDMATVVMEQLAQGGFSCVTVRQSEHQGSSRMVTFASAKQPKEGPPVVDVPANALRDLGLRDSESLQDVLSLTGLATDLPERLSKPWEAGLGVFLFNASEAQREAALLRSIHESVLALPLTRQIGGSVRHRSISRSELSEIRSWSGRLSVFDPTVSTY